MKRLTIAVDGFSSGGKSTFARAIAERLGYVFIDSGAMYRAVTLYALRHGLVSDGKLDEEALVRALDDIRIELRRDGVRLNGEDVTGEIRSIEVSDMVSRVSSTGAVRERLVAWQRDMGRDGGVVMDGRDIGTVVFPDADLKIFLTADPAVRAQRRYDELRAAGRNVSLAEIERNIRERDHHDQTREISPLRQASDAIVLDNSNMTLDEQMAWVEELLQALTGAKPPAPGLPSVEIDDKSGFCFGVVNAISKAEECVVKGSLVSLGDIVHNDAEMARLKALGLEIASEDTGLATLAGRTALIRAHGEPPGTYEKAHEYGITIIDATCPVVARLQKTVADAFRVMSGIGGQVVIFGRRGHAEIRGLAGQVNGEVTIIENEADLDAVDFTRPIYFLAQTTSSLAEFRRLGDEIKQRAAKPQSVTVHDTVCRQVSGREEHLAEFARRFDTVVFVSGAKSSNGRVLFEAVRAANPRCHNIESVAGLHSEWFETATSVGVCGATSTPRWLMKEVADSIRKQTLKWSTK